MPDDFSKASRVSLARAPLCVRGMAGPLSGWRLELTSAQGAGAILLVEAPGGATFYRGEGACLGRTQIELAQLYKSLLPDEAPPPEPLQLG